jgi:geranylgeranyl reductase family protein
MTDPIVIVGAGPAGSATASLLAARGARVLLLDSARFPRRKACAEYISPGGAAILASLGLDLRQRGRWLRGMHLRAPSGACQPIDYHDPSGTPRRGLAISRTELDAALVDIARGRGVEVREGCRVIGVALDSGRVTGVHLADGTVVRAPLVVGADGINSVVARAAGPTRRLRWPRRLGLVAHYADVAWPEEHGQMWVGRHGYVGIVPLDDAGLVSVGLVRPLGRRGPAAEALSASLADYPELAARLARGRRVESVIGVGPLERRVRASAGPGYVLVGDAAGFFDPFTGEGIYRALRGAQLVAQHLDALAQYPAARRQAFAAKERLTAVIQLFVRTPALLELAIRRLQQRPAVAASLSNILGDLEPAGLSLVWHLLRP